MNVIKRDGRKVEFDKSKISNAIIKANNEIISKDLNGSLSDEDIEKITSNICSSFYGHRRKITVEEIQDIVETELMKFGAFDIAKAYIRYRYDREKSRVVMNDLNARYEQINKLVNGEDEESKTENSNKDTRIVPTMRDYIAGFSCKSIAKNIILPKDISEADEKGIIHFHDQDYSPALPMNNCGLIDLDDMFTNSTVISETMIETPKSFRSASTIATQIITQVSSSQYGGNSISLAHLAPFVQISREKYRKKLREEFTKVSITYTDEQINAIAESMLKDEISDGIQTIQYQLITMSTTNGQAPFTTVFMYLNEAKNEQEKKDLAMIIEETLKQRIKGVKNKQGVYVTTAFPKLIYVLEEDNIHENSEYWYLTKLAAKCSAHRLVPDYISEKVMKKLKEGNCFPVMGCVDGQEVVTYNFDNKVYTESFERMWDRLSPHFNVVEQNGLSNSYYFVTDGKVTIFDSKNGFVNVKKVIRNMSDNWVNITTYGGRQLLCTNDHPLPTQRGRVNAEDLTTEDSLIVVDNVPNANNGDFNTEQAWLLGFILCDGCYDKKLSVSIAATGEDDIERAYRERVKKFFNLDTNTKEWDRGKKGHYKDIDAIGNVSNVIKYMVSNFEGVKKNDRHIPSVIFESNYSARIAFLAGMLDADGYINNSGKDFCVVQLGSTNKELAIQQFELAESCGMATKIYINHYSKVDETKIRYRIEFIPNDDLIKAMVCKKKIDKYISVENAKLPIGDVEYKKIKNIQYMNIPNKYSYDVETDSDFFDVSGIYSHNCRSALSPWKDENGNYKFYGRFNQGVVTINLPHAALSSGGDIDKFWQILDERLELCYRALMIRHESLKGTKSDVAPILWQHGAYARLKEGETIDKLLFGGYSTISLGYAGLYETIKYLTGESQLEENGHKLGIEIMQRMNDKCNEWKEKTNIGFSLYGSPIESTTYKFAKSLKRDFGEIEGITDKNYVTNSYHITPSQEIDAFSKLTIESDFQALSSGGSISYIETPNMTKNIDAILQIIKHIYNTIMYAEINTTTSYCQVCGCTDLKMHSDLKFHCPVCGNDDFDKMNVALRICGYISTNPFNVGRAEDIYSRVYHLDDKEFNFEVAE